MNCTVRVRAGPPLLLRSRRVYGFPRSKAYKWPNRAGASAGKSPRETSTRKERRMKCTYSPSARTREMLVIFLSREPRCSRRFAMSKSSSERPAERNVRRSCRGESLRTSRQFCLALSLSGSRFSNLFKRQPQPRRRAEEESGGELFSAFSSFTVFSSLLSALERPVLNVFSRGRWQPSKGVKS